MPSFSARGWPRTVRVAATLTTVIGICGILYWAQAVLIPIALAVLLTFLLTPPVVRLERLGLSRLLAVTAVVLIAAILFGGLAWLVGEQTAGLLNDLPNYRRNITTKISSVRSYFRGGAIENVEETIKEVEEDLEKEAATDESPTVSRESVEEEPIPVRIAPSEGIFSRTDGLMPIARGLATAGLVTVLVIFMLIKREDMLERGVSLVGRKSIATTTKALKEAGNRISRYLLMQFVINLGYGVALGIALSLIQMPYALLWGVCAAMLRYVPFVGPWVAAMLPATVAMIHFATWWPLLYVVAMFVVLEIVTNNVLEPLLYGRSAGTSEVAIILSAVFWAWMWGPLGLVMATPITVCLVVFGKYVPMLSIFDRLLSDHPALKPHIWLFQRLLSRDQEEAEEIVEEHLFEHEASETCDKLLLPALALTHREQLGGRITAEDEQFIVDGLAALIEDHIVLTANEAATGDADAASKTGELPIVVAVALLPIDEPALVMLKLLLKQRCDIRILPKDMLITQWVDEIEQSNPACICLSSLPPGKLTRSRLICKRFHQKFPELKIVVGRWGIPDSSTKAREAFKAAGAHATAGSLQQMCEQLIPIVQFDARRAKHPPLEKPAATPGD